MKRGTNLGPGGKWGAVSVPGSNKKKCPRDVKTFSHP